MESEALADLLTTGGFFLVLIAAGVFAAVAAYMKGKEDGRTESHSQNDNNHRNTKK